MLTLRLVPGSFIPPYATHYIGAGGVVLNGGRELLVVTEAIHRKSRPHYYKLPGGALKPGEHLVDGVMREICEETGIRTQFESLVCFRHWHGYRYGKSDIYFVCRLSPLSYDLKCQDGEIEQCLWLPVEEYLAAESVGVFNKRIVQAALECEGGLVPRWVEGYELEVDQATREIFLPRL
jgi:8-oxo-dGTP pyrophosphatase MutT (NUDIX family)